MKSSAGLSRLSCNAQFFLVSAPLYLPQSTQSSLGLFAETRDEFRAVPVPVAVVQGKSTMLALQTRGLKNSYETMLQTECLPDERTLLEEITVSDGSTRVRRLRGTEYSALQVRGTLWEKKERKNSGCLCCGGPVLRR